LFGLSRLQTTTNPCFDLFVEQKMKKQKTDQLIQRLDRQLEKKEKEQLVKSEETKPEVVVQNTLKKKKEKRNVKENLDSNDANGTESNEPMEQEGNESDEVMSKKELKRLKVQQLKLKLKKKRAQANTDEDDDEKKDESIEEESEHQSEQEELVKDESEAEAADDEDNEDEADEEEDDDEEEDGEEDQEEEDDAPKTKKMKTTSTGDQAPTKGKLSADAFPNKTVSIAVPASIILNAQTPDLKAYLIGQIARTAAIFNCYEIVVYDEYCTGGNYDDDECEEPKIECVRQMSRVLRYLECPQYLRKSLFPLHKDFKFAGNTSISLFTLLKCV
jgi:hypothetical protein